MTAITATISRTREWNYRQDGNTNRQKNRVYVSFAQGFSVLEDIVNRTNRPYQKVQPAVELALREAGFQFTRLRWDQKAGCSCPCSPGFIMEGQTAGPRKIDIYMQLSEPVETEVSAEGLERLAAVANDPTMPDSMREPATKALEALLP